LQQFWIVIDHSTAAYLATSRPADDHPTADYLTVI
jgi:hypothetical protein